MNGTILCGPAEGPQPPNANRQKSQKNKKGRSVTAFTQIMTYGGGASNG
jgi:hypothetical protein